MVVLDTCALIEICKNKPGLSTQTLQKIENGAYLLSISFAEIACKIKLGKLEMPLTSRELYKEFSQVENITLISIGVEEWLDSIELDWPDNKDPADRVLVSFAHKRKIPLVTSDIKIAQFYRKVLWS